MFDKKIETIIRISVARQVEHVVIVVEYIPCIYTHTLYIA
jgi:hypothetical protein